MLSDIEIARSVKLRPINEVAEELGLKEEQIENYGRYIAKVETGAIDKSKFAGHHLILVTAISPTKAGNGKTTVSVGLALGMQQIGKKAVVALREPSLGPCFGMKGGAAGGGYAQVLPMDKINLHFTGDFHAITEAGFGADLGAEKFYDIKCRKTGLQPDLTVLVVTLQALKMHGGVAQEDIKKPNIEGMKNGYWNLDKHVKNLQSFGQTVVIAFNKFATDTDEEIEVLRQHCEEMGCGFAVNNAFAEGGKGAVELANLVVKTIDEHPSAPLYFAYKDDEPVEKKIEDVAFNLYGAGSVTMSDSAKAMIEEIKKLGAEKFPICIAKTQYSFSTDAKAYGPTEGFELHVRDITVNMGAEMIVVIAGPIMRMPGLPKSPQAERIDVVNGEIVGLS